jgi:hypothetical protein
MGIVILLYGLHEENNKYNTIQYNKKVFTLQKKIVRPLMGMKSHNSYRDLFKTLESLTFPCEYIFSLINFMTNNEYF